MNTRVSHIAQQQVVMDGFTMSPSPSPPASEDEGNDDGSSDDDDANEDDGASSSGDKEMTAF